MEQKFGIKCNAIDYNSLKVAIPKEWRKVVRTMRVPPEAINFEEEIHIKVGKVTKNINQIKNNEIYWLLVNDIRIESIVTNKLQRELGLNEKECKMAFTMPRVVSNTKVRAFQYKLLYNLIPCNLYLKKIKRSDTDKCNWCDEEDNTTHYFVTCQQLIPFWHSFTKWWQSLLQEDLNFTVEEVLVGVLNNYTKYEPINACILLAKWHIYKNKLNQSETFFYRFLCELKFYINIEKSIALKNNNLIKYNTKWLAVEEHLT
jgi:hypothetical protein